MKYVVDTNIFSALMRGEPTVGSRLESVWQQDLLIPQPVLAEIAAGLARLPRSKRERQLRRDFERLAQLFPRSDWTDEVSATFGRIKAHLFGLGKPIEDFDVAIAAHALVEDAVLATDNVRHFERIPGLQFENWLLDD